MHAGITLMNKLAALQQKVRQLIAVLTAPPLVQHWAQSPVLLSVADRAPPSARARVFWLADWLAQTMPELLASSVNNDMIRVIYNACTRKDIKFLLQAVLEMIRMIAVEILSRLRVIRLQQCTDECSPVPLNFYSLTSSI
jgi:hypothetical protein